MLQGIETVNNYASINNNKNTNTKLVVNSNSESIIAASQEQVTQKIKKIDRSEKAAESKNQEKDKLLEFLERKVGRGEILSHDENLYVMGKKAKLYEQSMNMEKIRDRIIQRLSNKKKDETVEQIYKELTEELKQEYGVQTNSAEETASTAKETNAEQAEEYIRMSNALVNHFVEYAAVYEDSTAETESTSSEEEVEIKLPGSSSDDEVKTDYEKKIEARQQAEAEAAVSSAREKLNSRMFSRIDSSI